jgi:hypothetical protein
MAGRRTERNLGLPDDDSPGYPTGKARQLIRRVTLQRTSRRQLLSLLSVTVVSVTFCSGSATLVLGPWMGWVVFVSALALLAVFGGTSAASWLVLRAAKRLGISRTPEKP